MKIVNAKVFGADMRFSERELCFENGVITEKSSNGCFDAVGCYVLPGFIDTHIHGANGAQFCGIDAPLKPMLDWLSNEGVTGILATLDTEYPEELMQSIRDINELDDDRIIGIHAEGPFINPVRKGGMKAERIQSPSVELLRSMQECSGGRIKLITMAPELPDIEEVLKVCKELGIKASMGHTDASYEEAARGTELGFERATHMFNAMRPFSHRDPGIAGFALTDDRINCELICDMHHVLAPAVKLVVRSKGAENVTMISDNGFFAGMPDGEYSEGDIRLFVKDELCRLEDGTICGSTVSLAGGARNMRALGFSPEEIAVMACVNPAKAAGCTDRGELSVGKRADIIVLDEAFNVKAVFVKGQQIR